MRPKLQLDPVSPCISVCQLDDAGLCSGCLRTIDEITAWGSLTAAGKQEILNNIDLRRHDAAAALVDPTQETDAK